MVCSAKFIGAAHPVAASPVDAIGHNFKKYLYCQIPLPMNNLKVPLLACVLSTLIVHASAQRFSYGLNVGYTQIKYSFPVEKNRYHTSDIQPFNTLKGGAFIHYSVTNLLRIGTGLEYLSVKGSNDGGNIQRSLANPNSEGRMQFGVDNSFLILPVGFQLHISNGNIRPLLSGAMNFFKALDQSIQISIDPEDYDPFYEKVGTTIDDETESSYFGARIGGGIAFSALKDHEFSLLISRHFNVSRYELGDPTKGIFEKHEIRFNMWEFSACVDFQTSEALARLTTYS